MKPSAFRCRTGAYLILLIFCSPMAAYGATELDSPLSATFRLIWGLLIVLGILFIIYGLMKKKASFLQSGKGLIKIVEIRHLMPKRTLYLVEVRGQEFLLGAGSDGINLLAAINPNRKDSFAEVLDKSETEISS